MESCFLSTDPDACSSTKGSASWTLNNSNNERLYDVTEHYVYTITGLRSDDIPSPCKEGYIHRWIKISDNDSSCSSSGVGEATRTTLQKWLEENNSNSNDKIIDVNLNATSANSDTCNPADTKAMKLSYDGNCYQHSHPDELDVYDFTYWTLPNTHPGNEGAAQNPIKKWVSNDFTLEYPSWHPMSRWENEKMKFDYLGRSGDETTFRSLPGKLRLPAVLDEFGSTTNNGEGVVVCGSPGEIKTKKVESNIFHFNGGKFLRCTMFFIYRNDLILNLYLAQNQKIILNLLWTLVNRSRMYG